MGDSKILETNVRYVAGLARLDVSDEEMGTLTVQLNSILSYMDKLNELDTSGVEPMSHVIDACNAYREDMVRDSFTQTLALDNAPDKEKGFFKVPKIIGD